MSDPVESPDHYALLDPEPIDVIEGWGLNFSRGAALKYLARAGRKGDGVAAELQDLRKCLWFVRREIARLERGIVCEGDGSR